MSAGSRWSECSSAYEAADNSILVDYAVANNYRMEP